MLASLNGDSTCIFNMTKCALPSPFSFNLGFISIAISFHIKLDNAQIYHNVAKCCQVGWASYLNSSNTNCLVVQTSSGYLDHMRFLPSFTGKIDYCVDTIPCSILTFSSLINKLHPSHLSVCITKKNTKSKTKDSNLHKRYELEPLFQIFPLIG